MCCTYKTCTRCKELLPITHYGMKNKTERRSACRECIREHNRRRDRLARAQEKQAKAAAAIRSAGSPPLCPIAAAFNRWGAAPVIPMW